MVKIEEFMVFENDDGATGVIIKNTDNSCKWWKCNRTSGGQIFNEDKFDENYTNIIKLYKSNALNYSQFRSLKFMTGTMSIADFNYYFECVYDKEKENRIKSNSIEIKVSINTDDIEDIENTFKELKNKLENITITLRS